MGKNKRQRLSRQFQIKKIMFSAGMRSNNRGGVMEVRDGLKYTKDHEWAKIDGDVVTIGITDFAQGELGDVVFVELPETGKMLEKEQSFGTIEAVKAVADLFSPISGEVLEINEALKDAPETINKECYGAGWMIKIKVSNPEEINGLMDAAAYREMLG
jgi:glycine cleavage system H protein